MPLCQCQELNFLTLYRDITNAFSIATILKRPESWIIAPATTLVCVRMVQPPPSKSATNWKKRQIRRCSCLSCSFHFPAFVSDERLITIICFNASTCCSASNHLNKQNQIQRAEEYAWSISINLHQCSQCFALFLIVHWRTGSWVCFCLFYDNILSHLV